MNEPHWTQSTNHAATFHAIFQWSWYFFVNARTSDRCTESWEGEWFQGAPRIFPGQVLGTIWMRTSWPFNLPFCNENILEQDMRRGGDCRAWWGLWLGTPFPLRRCSTQPPKQTYIQPMSCLSYIPNISDNIWKYSLQYILLQCIQRHPAASQTNLSPMHHRQVNSWINIYSILNSCQPMLILCYSCIKCKTIATSINP